MFQNRYLRGLRALLPGFVNLRRRHGFGKRQRGIFHQHSPHQRDEQHAEDAAHHHQRGGFPVSVRGIEGGPRSGDQKRRQREHRAGRDRFADGAGGARDVLFQQRALPHPHHRHADHRGRIRGRDGHARAQAQIGVGRAQHHGHRQAQHQRLDGELRHLGVFGNKRTMFGWGHDR